MVLALRGAGRVGHRLVSFLPLVIRVTRDSECDNARQLQLNNPIYITRLLQARDQGCPAPKPAAALLARPHHQIQRVYRFFR